MGEQYDVPTFMVIGAQKSGTSWLSEMMRQHPDITSSIEKEVHFFNKQENYKRGLDGYRSAFPMPILTKAVGEYTPNYFWTSNQKAEIEESGRTENVPGIIHSHLPNLKIIILLRDPVNRAVSAFFHHIREGRISPDKKITEVLDHYGIKSMGFYIDHLKEWLRYYPRDQIQIYFYETDLADQNKSTTLQNIFRFIDVDPDYRSEGLFEKQNQRGSYLELHMASRPALVKKAVKYLIPEKIKMNKRWEVKVSDREIEYLKAIYKEKNRELSEFLDVEINWK